MTISRTKARLRALLMAWTFALLACTAGCFSGEVNVVVNGDGSADLKTTLVSHPMIGQLVEQAKTSTVEKNPDAKVTPVTKQNMTGYEIVEHYDTIEGLSTQSFFAANEGQNTGITVNRGFFYDDYNFDLLYKGNAGAGGGELAKNIAFTYQMTLPDAPLSSNAEQTSEDGKTLTWNLGRSLTTGEDVRMQATFRLWHKGAVAGTIVALLLLGGALFCFRRRKSGAAETPIQAEESPANPLETKPADSIAAAGSADTADEKQPKENNGEKT